MTTTRSTPSVIARLDHGLAAANRPPIDVPECDLLGFLAQHARVRLRNGSYARFDFIGRRPLIYIAELLHKIIRNTRHRETVVIDGVQYAPGTLKGASVAACGGAQFGKTVLELNLIGHATTVDFLNAGYYTSDKDLLATIVDTKFRPDVVDQVPWMASMISLNKSEGKSGRSVDRKNAFQVSNGRARAFGYFNGMQRPPTTITLDIAVLDEVDDIPEKNIGFISGRMTNSDVALTCYIGTQRIHAAGQNARWSAGTMHKWMTRCPDCGREFCLEEHWPGVCRIAVDGARAKTDPKLSETMQYDPDATYYAACPECGAALDPDSGHFVAEHPERARQRVWSVRIAQMDIPALAWGDIVAAWFAALADPNPEAMAAWHCDRRAIPYAGAAQPITPEVLARARAAALADVPEDVASAKPYAMSLVATEPGGRRFAGVDTGPRCWLTITEHRSAMLSPLVWAEMVASGSLPRRLAELYTAGAFGCVFLDAGGEPDLTKRVVLALNGLAEYSPPVVPAAELRGLTLSNIGHGCTWHGERGLWSGIKAAAVEFSLRDAGGIQQTVGITQDGRIYPLIKANRGESIQGLVNWFLTPAEGVLEQCAGSLRMLPRLRLPRTCIGPGVTETILDTHLQNLRRVRDTAGHEDWADGVENHLGLSLNYARIAELCGSAPVGATSGVSRREWGEGEAADRRDRRAGCVPNRSRRAVC